MTDDNSKEVIEALKRIEKQLEEIKYHVSDMKREMPKIPYYGDLLQDIVNAFENMHR